MTTAGQSLRDASTPMRFLVHPKTKVRIGCWNVRTMYQIGKTAQVCREMENYKLDLVGISESRWTGMGKLQTQTGQVIIYSGKEDRHEYGVALVMSKEAAKSLISWKPCGERLLTARFNSRHVKMTIIQAYAPTNTDSDASKDQFYEQLQAAYEETPKHDILVTMGDWNAKVGKQMPGEGGIVGSHALQTERNDNGERFVSSCAANNMAIVSTQFKHKDIHKYTWTSPDGRTRNQIDYITVNGKFRSSIHNARAYRGADVGSDHNLVVCDMKLRLQKVYKPASQTVKFDTRKLKNSAVRDKFVLTLKNRFSCLQEQDAGDLEEQWNHVKETFNKTAESVLGHQRSKTKPWISEDSWSKIDKRKEIKQSIDSTRSLRLKEQKREEYRTQDRETKRSLRKDKEEWMEGLAQEAEDSMQCGNLKGVYSATKKLCNQHTKKMDSVRSKDGRLLTTESEVQQRWKEHFNEVLNRPEPLMPADIPEETLFEVLNLSEEPLSKEEIISTLKDLKSGKAAGYDAITPEVLKADESTTANILEGVLKKIWVDEAVPEDWKMGLIIKIPKKGDLTQCGNWRGITLLSMVGKVLGRSIIKRLRDDIDRRLRKEQSAFRRNRGTTEPIFILRNIVEQSLEWNSALYLVFIDYEKAFDSIHRETLWEIMRQYGIPGKYIRLVKMFYENDRCSVITEGGVGAAFNVKSGVKQGCVMSGFLFILVIDWIMRRTLSQGDTGIQWKLTEKLEDLDYADDIVTVSSKLSHAQQKVDRLNMQGKSVGLNINKGKTKTIRINANRMEPVKVGADDIEEVDKFQYLGAYVDKTGGADHDIRCRTGKAWGAFNKFSKVWRSGKIRRRTKLRLFNSNVLSVLLYGCETWKMNKEDERRLDVFQQKGLRRIMKIRWPMRISNEEVRVMSSTKETVSQVIRRRRWKLIGHILRSDNEHTKTALTWTPPGKRSRGRPKETWRRTVERERKQMGFATWGSAGAVARDRTAWRSFIRSPIAHPDRRT